MRGKRLYASAGCGRVSEACGTTWKWDHFEMVFVSELPRTSRGWNSVWVFVDRLTKAAHFLSCEDDGPVDCPVQTVYRGDREMAWSVVTVCLR